MRVRTVEQSLTRVAFCVPFFPTLWRLQSRCSAPDSASRFCPFPQLPPPSVPLTLIAPRRVRVNAVGAPRRFCASSRTCVWWRGQCEHERKLLNFRRVIVATARSCDEGEGGGEGGNGGVRPKHVVALAESACTKSRAPNRSADQ